MTPAELQLAARGTLTRLLGDFTTPGVGLNPQDLLELFGLVTHPDRRMPAVPYPGTQCVVISIGDADRPWCTTKQTTQCMELVSPGAFAGFMQVVFKLVLPDGWETGAVDPLSFRVQGQFLSWRDDA